MKLSSFFTALAFCLFSQFGQALDDVLKVHVAMVADDAVYFSGQSLLDDPIESMSVNDVDVPIDADLFRVSLPVKETPTSFDVDVTLRSGRSESFSQPVGAPTRVDITRSIYDAGQVLIDGYVESTAPIHSVTIDGALVPISNGNEFSYRAPIELAKDSQVSVQAITTQGSVDTVWLEFSKGPVEEGVSLTLLNNGLAQLAPLIKGAITPQLTNIGEALTKQLNLIEFDWFLFKLRVEDAFVQIDGLDDVTVTPGDSRQSVDVNSALSLSNVTAGFVVKTEACIWFFGRICEPRETKRMSFSVSDASIDTRFSVTPDTYVHPVDPNPATAVQTTTVSASIATVDAAFKLSVDDVNIQLGEWEVDNFIFDAIVNVMLSRIVSTEISQLINNGIESALNVVPSYIPAVMANLGASMDEIVTGFSPSLLPIVRILAQGIGAHIQLGEGMSNEHGVLIPFNLGLFNESSDKRVHYGYVSTPHALSKAQLESAEPPTNGPHEGRVYIKTNTLNNVLRSLSQAGVLDFTLAHSKVADAQSVLSELNATQLRFRPDNSAPYFSLPHSDQIGTQLNFNHWIIDLLNASGQVLVSFNVDFDSVSQVRVAGSRLAFDATTTDIKRVNIVNPMSLSVVQSLEGNEALVNSLVRELVTNTLSALGDVLVPSIPSLGRLVSVESWRPDPLLSDLMFSVDFAPLVDETNAANTSNALDASVVSNNATASDPSSSESSSSAASANASDAPSILSFIQEYIHNASGVLTNITNNPVYSLAEGDVQVPYDPNAVKPQVPSINRQPVAMQNGRFTRPRMTGANLSRDGRIGIPTFGTFITLLKPEMIHETFTSSDKELFITDDLYDLKEHNFGIRNHGICDADPEHYTGGKKENPYSCGENGLDDCYDVTLFGDKRLNHNTFIVDLIGSLSEQNSELTIDRSVLMGVPLTITVKEPKTAKAYIAHVEVHKDKVKYAPDMSSNIFEVNTSNDGRLMVTRISGRSLTWYNERTGKYVTGTYDIVYAVMPEDAEPCDISAFQGFKPISHAPFDERMARYSFAAHPFRDPLGQLIEDGADMKATYPWMSGDGSMLSVTAIGPGAALFPGVVPQKGMESRYPSRCLDHDTDCSAADRIDVDNTPMDVGVVFLGLWTQGKMVLADGVINESDFLLGKHSVLALYEPNTGKQGNESGDVEVGSTRAFGEVAPDIVGIGALDGNGGSIFNSPTNKLNFWEHLVPITPNDIVWNVSTGRQTDEVSFDDMNNPDALIVSSMVGALNYRTNMSLSMLYYNGWDQTTQSYINPVYVENSATALPERWRVPRYGHVRSGRLEPTATGGIHGKGMWFNGVDTSVTYDMPEQSRDVGDVPLFVSVFIDPRYDHDAQERVLIEFPNGAALTLLGLNRVVYRDAQGEIQHSVTLSQPLQRTEWNHVALQLLENKQFMQLYVNGVLHDEYRTSEPVFALTQGKWVLGLGYANKQSAMFKGWMDDFKVIAQQLNPEVICNHAKGTLVGYDPSVNQVDASLSALRMTPLAHAQYTRVLEAAGRPVHEDYRCFVNYSADYGAHLKNAPQHSVPLRDSFLFPEGPVFHDAPRPDSLNNTFCLSCHHDQGKGGLSLKALEPRDQLAKEDVRRQPRQSRQKVSGNLPKHWLKHSPSQHTITPDGGVFFDELILDSVLSIQPNVTAMTLVNARTGEDIQAIKDGTVLNLSVLPEDLAIRVVANGAVQSVEYRLSGALGSSSGTLRAPFAIFGVDTDEAGNRRYRDAALSAGEYVLMAQPSEVERSVEVRFSVIDDRTEAQARLASGAQGVIATWFDWLR